MIAGGNKKIKNSERELNFACIDNNAVPNFVGVPNYINQFIQQADYYFIFALNS
jgi:hypothetical protein